MALSFGGFSGAAPSYADYSSVDMQGLANQLNRSSDLAGSYLNTDRIKQFVDAFSPYLRENEKWLAPMMAFQQIHRESAEDPQRLKEKLDVLRPWYEDIAKKSQQFGLQSNLVGAGLKSIEQIPNTMLAMRALPLQAMGTQVGNLDSMFTAYGGSRPAFSGLRNRLGLG